MRDSCEKVLKNHISDEFQTASCSGIVEDAVKQELFQALRVASKMGNQIIIFSVFHENVQEIADNFEYAKDIEHEILEK